MEWTPSNLRTWNSLKGRIDSILNSFRTPSVLKNRPEKKRLQEVLGMKSGSKLSSPPLSSDNFSDAYQLILFQ